MINFIKKWTEPSPEQRKAKILNEIKSWNTGDVMSKQGMKVYINALNNNEESLATVYLNLWADLQQEFLLTEFFLDELPPLRYLRSESENQRDQKVNNYLRKIIENKGWYPPILIDIYKEVVVDGNHRALALRKLGRKKVMAFVGLKHSHKKPFT